MYKQKCNKRSSLPLTRFNIYIIQVIKELHRMAPQRIKVNEDSFTNTLPTADDLLLIAPTENDILSRFSNHVKL